MDFKVVYEYTKELSVLYVEDDELLRESMGDILTDYFKEVDFASDGEEGLSSYTEYKEREGKFYDIVITDVTMPKMNGLLLSEKILKVEPDQAIIIISAHNESDYLYKAINMGVENFLFKPLDLNFFDKGIYKTALRIHDKRLLESHYTDIEELNLKLLDQNTLLEKQNRELEKKTRIIDTVTHKEKFTSKCQTSRHVSSSEETDSMVNEQDEMLVTLIVQESKELMEINDTIDARIATVLMGDVAIVFEDETIVEEIASSLLQYAHLISTYSIFSDLSAALLDLGQVIQSNLLPQDEEKVKNIFTYFESLIYSLDSWLKSWINNDLDNIRFYYDSIVSDVKTMVTLWRDEECKNVDDDVDF